jgi:hypothetical protein
VNTLEHIRPLIIKYIYLAAITIIFFTYLLVPSVPLSSSLVIALFATLVLYFVGDLFLQPRFGSVAAAIGNFILAAIVYSLASAFVQEPLTAGAVLAAAAVVGVVEWAYYRYAREMMVPAAAGEADRAEPAAEMALEEESGEENPEHQQ